MERCLSPEPNPGEAVPIPLSAAQRESVADYCVDGEDQSQKGLRFGVLGLLKNNIYIEAGDGGRGQEVEAGSGEIIRWYFGKGHLVKIRSERRPMNDKRKKGKGQ
jgi:hypothetical protein